MSYFEQLHNVRDTVDMVVAMKEENGQASKSNQDHITISPPVDSKTDDGEMEEVDYTKLYKQRALTVSDKKRVDKIAGLSSNDAKVILEKLKEEGILTDYSIITLGSGYTMDYVASRAQVFVDKSGNVTSVRIG